MRDDFGLPIPAYRVKITLAALIPLAVFGLAYWLLGCVIHPRVEFRHTAFYVWQQTTDPVVQEAIERARDEASGYLLYAGDYLLQNDRVQLKIKRQDWSYLASLHPPLTLVFRFEGPFSSLLQQPDLRGLAGLLREGMQTVIRDARARGAAIHDVQLDYDCPTSKLPDYQRLVALLRTELQPLPLSITALPTWLQSMAFLDLVRYVDYYVLQVHSLEKPASIQDPVSIFDHANLDRYLQAAAHIAKPFYLALPTYGYQLIFDAEGAFIGLTAEGPAPELQPGYQSRVVLAEAQEIVMALARLKTCPPRHCLGIVWFRLPIASDRLNWAWPALQAVLQGREPIEQYTVEQRQPSPGLVELWIHNVGEQNRPNWVRFLITPPSQPIVAYDMFNEYRFGSIPNQLIGPAPYLEKPLLAAWYRIASGSEPIPDLSVSSVEIVP